MATAPRARGTRAPARAAAAPVPEGVRQPLGRRYAGDTVNIQYMGGGELTLRSRTLPGAQYNFSRGSVVAVALEDAPRFLNNKDFQRVEPKAAAPKPAEDAPETPPADTGVPTFPDKPEDKSNA